MIFDCIFQKFNLEAPSHWLKIAPTSPLIGCSVAVFPNPFSSKKIPGRLLLRLVYGPPLLAAFLMGSALAKACEAPLARCCWGADDHATHYAGVLDAAELSRAPSAMTIASSRRLSRSKTGLLLVDPVTVSLLADEELKKARSENATQVEAADAVVTLAGGVPGLALDGQRVELTEFTGARSGGYRVRPSTFGNLVHG